MWIAPCPWPLATLLSLSTLASAQGTSNKQDSRDCFFPDGIQSSGGPCFPDQAVSPCCGPGFVCLSNGLCQPGPDTRKSYQYTVYRSSCTDRTWNSTDCPRVCLSCKSSPFTHIRISVFALVSKIGNTLNPVLTGTPNIADDRLDSGQGLATCGTGGSYCCGRGYDCCSNGTNIFTYGTAEIVTTIPIGSSSSSSSSAASSTAAASSSASSSSSSSSPSNATSIGVGVGVGVGGFAILLASVLLFLMFRRRRKEQAKQQGASSPHDEEGHTPRGTELQADEMKQGGGAFTSPPPTYRSDSNVHTAVSSPGGEERSGGMTPGAPLNPAEFPSGPERERFEMEGQHPESWKGAPVRSDAQRHELE